MAITRAQQFRQMLEDGGMLVSPSTTGKRPGYREEDAQKAREASRKEYVSRTTQSQRDDDREEFKAQRKQATQRLKKKDPTRPATIFSDLIDKGGLGISFLRNLKDSEFNKRRKQKFLDDIIKRSKNFQGVRNIKIPFLGEFDTNKGRQNINLIAKLTAGLDLENLPTDQQNEIYDKIMDARMAGQTDAAGNLKAGFMFDAQGNIISTGNDGRDLEAEQRALIAQTVNPNQATTPTEQTTIDPGFYRLLADGGRAEFRQAGIAGREYDKADTATKEAISREQDRGATPTSEEFRDQARDIRRREIPKIVKQAAGAVSLFTPIGQIEEARKFKKFLQMKKAIDLGKNIKDVYTPLPTEDEDETLGDLPGSDLRADVSAMDIRRKGQLQSVDYETAKDIGMINPTMTKEEFEGVKSGEITEPTGQFAKDGGRIGAMEGGIMDLETGRQMYFLGKLVKKATRAVKKIVKSPIGKAAIGAALFKAGGGLKGLSGLKGKLLGVAGADEFGGTAGLLKDLGLIKGGFGDFEGLTGRGMLGLGALLTSAPLLFGKQEDDNNTIDPALLGPRIDIARLLARPYEATLGTGFVRSAADGGRIGFQEGGIFPRLNQLSGSVSSAEQMLQDINQRLQSAESSLGGGGVEPLAVRPSGGFSQRPVPEFMQSKSIGTLPGLQQANMSRPGMKYQEPENLTVSAIPASGMQLPISRGGPGPDQLSGIAAASYAKGGDVEPVAKKTMPLLDLKGQEMDLRDNGGFVPIGRMEKADDVPARLSKNEFVFTADAVRNAGDGDIDKGAEVMYNMMKNLEDGGNVSEESQGLEGARNMFQTAQRLEEVL